MPRPRRRASLRGRSKSIRDYEAARTGGLVAFRGGLRYYLHVSPRREQLLQLARLTGAAAFADRFGPPQTADPEVEALRSLVEERLGEVARSLVEEAAASDDVTDIPSAEAYLEDRLRTLGDLLTKEQTERIRVEFRDSIKAW